ncbi:L,D-transpeptidase family protein [Wenxinia saemankumensis]|uniref:L,D-peptidoglycan transpeptidase YkuD, ErfK/YbiS/YcfS/YnhG family n=1 Tax=Wenxinia saemankumensis TaxID=1447782 RepID=A0A1M6FWP8_9RHOB|nr:L,D-transpeptidase family protein [Wenxinia saemankumensis]SHJ02133.1 L,D-peptidoglycan transpeptidase YkuD, ErfK/YbiS/YcfS/YnhG family [Wenxinia saemankumensis]
MRAGPILVRPVAARAGILSFDGLAAPCALGRGGIVPPGEKREGDGATPRGPHRVVQCWYRPDRVPRPAPWAIPIGPGDLWCDAPDHPAYNAHVRAPFPAGHERLRRGDRLYDIVMVLDWNWPDAVPGRGSAIFVHRWRAPGRPTEGCVALPPAALRRLAAAARPGTPLLVR